MKEILKNKKVKKILSYAICILISIYISYLIIRVNSFGNRINIIITMFFVIVSVLLLRIFVKKIKYQNIEIKKLKIIFLISLIISLGILVTNFDFFAKKYIDTTVVITNLDEKNQTAKGNNVTIRQITIDNVVQNLGEINFTNGWSYDENENAYIIDKNSTKNLRELLTDKNGVGFVAIGKDSPSENLAFSGIFDGQNYEIQNLYENTEKAGLFEKINATIKNLGLVNVDMIATGNSGGISSAYYGSKLYNIYVSGNITGKNVGGIVGNGGGSTEFINCCNLANVHGAEGAAGIVKYADIGSNINIVNSYNLGEIIGMGTRDSYDAVGGIIGAAYNTGTRKIINSCSLGEISKPKGIGRNFYYAWDATPFELQNCYYLDSIINEKVIANENSIAFSKGDESVINKLNTYVKEHKNDYAVELYTWKLDSNGLPTFEK